MSRTRRRHTKWLYVFHGHAFDDSTQYLYSRPRRLHLKPRVLETELVANGVPEAQARYIASSTQVQVRYCGKIGGYDGRDRSCRRMGRGTKQAAHQIERHAVKVAITVGRECPVFRRHTLLWNA